MNLYVLELLFSGVHARVAVNGIEIVEDESAASKTIGYRINPYVVDGENRLAVALRLPPPPPAAGPAAPSASAAPDFTARVIGGVHGRDPGPAGVLLEHAWNPASEPVTAGAWKLVFNRPWTAPAAFGRWAWQDAPAVPPSPADRAALLAEVATLHAAASRRDGAALLDAHRLKFAELARAMDAPVQEFESDLADAFAAMFPAADYRVAPLDTGRLSVEPLAGGQLVRVRNADGAAPIRLSGGGETLHLQPVFTRVAGRWLLAR